MAMHDALHVWPGFHNFEVQHHFAGSLFLAGDLVAFHVDEANVLRLQKTFAVHRGRAEDFVLVEAHADVAVVRRGETTLIDSVADLADGFLKFLDVLHFYLSTEPT